MDNFQNESLEATIQFRKELAMNTDRHLDRAPKPITLRHINPNTQFDITNSYTSLYNTVVKDFPEQQCYIELNGVTASCDYIPFVCVKSLLLSGLCKDPLLSKTCLAMFKRLVGTASMQTDHGIVITTDSFQLALSNLNIVTHYAHSIMKGIRTCAFPQSYIKMYWNEIAHVNVTPYKNACKVGEQYLAAHKEINTEEKLNELLRDAYNTAKKKKDFINTIDTTNTSKELIGMMYLTFLNNPEVFIKQTPESADGFAP